MSERDKSHLMGEWSPKGSENKDPNLRPGEERGRLSEDQAHEEANMLSVKAGRNPWHTSEKILDRKLEWREGVPEGYKSRDRGWRESAPEDYDKAEKALEELYKASNPAMKEKVLANLGQGALALLGVILETSISSAIDGSIPETFREVMSNAEYKEARHKLEMLRSEGERFGEIQNSEFKLEKPE